MKMVKSLLLGSAAGLVAVGGAQAADLPVKAKPVEYVKICTLYGEGYYYIPGSDTCIKFGGYVRADYGWNVAGSRTPAYSGTQGAQDRTVSQYSTRHRGNLQVDTRTQTQYGTLRTFTSLHFQNEDGVFSQNVARAFIQWAGFTFGHAQSFQDTWGITDSWHYAQEQNNSDTGANGVNQIAYTWELGNGMTLTVGADEQRRKSIANLSVVATIAVGREPVSSFRGQEFPDPHIDFKVNQAWGYWATSFVAHDASASYYNGGGNSTACGTAGAGTFGAPLSSCGHPNNRIGWAAQTGAELKMDMITPGDRLGFGVRYAEGASGYGGGSNLATASLFGPTVTSVPASIGSLAFGPMTDGVFLNGSQIQLTTTWTAMAGYEHLWTPTLKTSFTAGYSAVLYNSSAKSMFATNMCGVPVSAAGSVTPANLPGTNANLGAQAGINNLSNCDPDWGFFQGGIRTQWNVAPGFYLGVDTFYTHVFTAFKGSVAQVNGATLGATSGNATLINPIIGGRPNGLYAIRDLGTFGMVFRAQRAFNAGD